MYLGPLSLNPENLPQVNLEKLTLYLEQLTLYLEKLTGDHRKLGCEELRSTPAGRAQPSRPRFGGRGA